MRDKLAKLYELQRLDDSLRETRDLGAALENLKRQNEHSLAQFDRMLAQRVAQIAETEAFCKVKLNEIAQTEEDIKRSRSRMTSITSQRELTALNKELETARRIVMQRSEELKALNTQLEQVRADHAARMAERSALEASMAEVVTQRTAELKSRHVDIESSTERRNALCGELGAELISRYERIARSRNGTAVVDSSSGRCGACNISVSPQVFIRLQRMESLEACGNCQRMLVFVRGLSGQVDG